jgi:hypothetical protein
VSAALRILRAFAAADVAGWQGLPDAIVLADVGGVLPLEGGATGTGFLGAERRSAGWIGAESETYEGGLLIWHDEGRVLLLEGRDPVGVDGAPLAAPDLGEPEAALDTVLGRLRLDGGELVYAARGLALRVNPENGLLLGVLGFVPASAEEYRTRLRPELPPRQLLPDPASHGSTR